MSPMLCRLILVKMSVIIADGLGNSEGGKVIVWADETTNFYGNVSARGAGTGDGGFVEISGKETLLFRGEVDTSSELGNTGDFTS